MLAARLVLLELLLEERLGAELALLLRLLLLVLVLRELLVEELLADELRLELLL